jgi:hypothetical protein
MGNDDLKAMAARRMDPSGRNLTKVGRICGIVGSLILILTVAVFIVAAIVVVLTRE